MNPLFTDLIRQHLPLPEAECVSLVARFKDNLPALRQYLVEKRPELRHEIGKLWGDSMGVAYVDPAKTLIQYPLLKKLPITFAKEHNILPFYEIDGVVTVATDHPEDNTILRQLETFMDMMASPVFAFPDQIQAAIEIGYLSQQSLTELMGGANIPPSGSPANTPTSADLLKLANEKSVMDFSRALILLAFKNRASDIHIEPDEENLRVRFRIDGTLNEILRLDSALLPPLINRLKIMANADIAENRKPQDGRISFQLPDRSLDLRFSSVPTLYGEKAVLRLLGQSEFTTVPDLEELGFSKSILDGIHKIVQSPNGVFFVTGPTGSGKTSTLYAALKYINKPAINITTIEDPIEYHLQGINQVQVNTLAGVTFASALRAFLRQDPDVILIGEIRDLETATIASQAALTGHLVLTTMHTNNALQAVTRLIQIGVEPFLVAPAIIGVMAQRLVRRLCDACKEQYALEPREIKEIFMGDGQGPVVFFRAKGCEQCNYTGFSGRIAIHELFVIDEETRNYIARNASILDIQRYAVKTGFSTMRYDGFKKVLRGLTTVDEINKVTIMSESA